MSGSRIQHKEASKFPAKNIDNNAKMEILIQVTQKAREQRQLVATQAESLKNLDKNKIQLLKQQIQLFLSQQSQSSDFSVKRCAEQQKFLLAQQEQMLSLRQTVHNNFFQRTTGTMLSDFSQLFAQKNIDKTEMLKQVLDCWKENNKFAAIQEEWLKEQNNEIQLLTQQIQHLQHLTAQCQEQDKLAKQCAEQYKLLLVAQQAQMSSLQKMLCDSFRQKISGDTAGKDESWPILQQPQASSQFGYPSNSFFSSASASSCAASLSSVAEEKGIVAKPG